MGYTMQIQKKRLGQDTSAPVPRQCRVAHLPHFCPLLHIKLIPLTRGKYAIVDKEDFEELAKYKWYVNHNNFLWYACRQYRNPNILNSKGKSKQVVVLMHRQIMKASKGSNIDHQNHYALDNRKTNLRFCSQSQNSQNSLKRKATISKYKGVFLSRGKWRVCICYKGTKISLGRFNNIETAARQYDKIAKLLFGEFACLNFPD